ncbi:MAG: prepilin-type N-terminal cleavage/methylation domain-containing protein [Pseudomonadota bacterium]
MRNAVAHHNPHAGPRRRARGFSLIEVLIVLSMIGLVAIVVMPGLQSSLTRAEARAAAIELRTEVARLRAEAWERQIRIILVDPTAATGEVARDSAAGIVTEQHATITTMPRGWQYKLSAPIIFEPRGVCRGGLARVENASGDGLDLNLAPPFCTAEIR